MAVAIREDVPARVRRYPVAHATGSSLKDEAAPKRIRPQPLTRLRNCSKITSTVKRGAHGVPDRSRLPAADLPAIGPATSRGRRPGTGPARGPPALGPRPLAPAGDQPQHRGPRLYGIGTGRDPEHAPGPGGLRGPAQGRVDQEGPQGAASRSWWTISSPKRSTWDSAPTK